MRPARSASYSRGGGALPSNRLMGMCRWMGSHFHDWIDYNGVAFSTESEGERVPLLMLRLIVEAQCLSSNMKGLWN